MCRWRFEPLRCWHVCVFFFCGCLRNEDLSVSPAECVLLLCRENGRTWSWVLCWPGLVC